MVNHQPASGRRQMIKVAPCSKWGQRRAYSGCRFWCSHSRQADRDLGMNRVFLLQSFTSQCCVRLLNSRLLEVDPIIWSKELGPLHTFGWFGRYRRLSRDYERQAHTGETMVYLAMIRLMLARLVRHLSLFQTGSNLTTGPHFGGHFSSGIIPNSFLAKVFMFSAWVLSGLPRMFSGN